MRRAELVLLLTLGVAGPGGAWAADPTNEQKLQSVERDLRQSREQGQVLSRQSQELAAEAARLQAQEVAAAKSVQDNEQQLGVLERAVAQLETERAAEAVDLERSRRDETVAIAALERIALMPPATVIFAPGAPIDLARGGMLLSAAVPRLEARAGEHTAALARLEKTQSDIGTKRNQLRDRQQALEADRVRLASLLQQKQKLQGVTAEKAKDAEKRAAALAARANDLRQLIDRAERDRQQRERAERERTAAQAAAVPPPLPEGKMASGVGHMVTPVVGDLVKRYGDTDGFQTSKGLSFATRPGAQVVAPASGEIMFAGPFKGYGQILIIEQSDGYHCVLAGIGRIQGAAGQKVVAGEPIGTMPSDGTPTLYLELRRQGQPVNPLPWLAARDLKANG